MKDIVMRAHGLFLGVAEALQAPLLLLIRLYWGWQFAQTGLGKFHNMPRVVDFFASLGIPFPALNAHFIATLELSGGILLMLGLGARLISLPLTISMTVAYITADREALVSFLSDPDKFIAAAPFSFLLASLLILAFGPGRVSLDEWIACKCYGDRSSAPAASEHGFAERHAGEPRPGNEALR